MIIVKNRELLIPNNERYIGTTYDTETENRIFQVPRYSQRGVDLAALTFRLDIQYANESYDTIVLDKEIGEAFVILIWRITSATLQVPGTMYIGLRAVDDEATVKWSSFSAAMYVERHLNTPGNYGGGLSEIEQMEQDHQYMKGVVNELKEHIDYTFESEAWAVGKRDGEDVPETDPTYHNNSKYYKEESDAHRKTAERYANGKENGTDVTSGEGYHDNSKYYKELADDHRKTAEAYAKGTVDGTAVTSGQTGYQDNAKYYKEQVQSRLNQIDTNTSNIAVQTARIDQFTHLAEGSTTGDAELMDARVGADGVTYTSAGAATRANDSLLKSHLEAIDDIVLYFDDTLTWTLGELLKWNTGEEVSNVSYAYTKVTVAETALVVHVKSTFSSLAGVCFYDANDTYISGIKNDTGVDLFDDDIDIPKGTKYIGVSCYTNDRTSASISTTIKQQMTSVIKKFDTKLNLPSLYTIQNVTIAQGIRHTNGTIYNPSSDYTGRYASGHFSAGDKLKLSGYSANTMYPLLGIKFDDNTSTWDFGATSTAYTDQEYVMPKDGTIYVNGITTAMPMVKKLEALTQEDFDTLIFDESENTAILKAIYSNGKLKVKKRISDTTSICVEFSNVGGNSLFNFSGIYLCDEANAEVMSNDFTSNGTAIAAGATDWFGPYIVQAVNNADGDVPEGNSYFTGGNHRSNNTGSGGGKTATQVSLAILIDGKTPINEKVYYATEVIAKWSNDVQGNNTSKSDGSGRAILTENWTMRINLDGIFCENDIVPKEDITIKTYYGLQIYFPGASVIYKGGVTRTAVAINSASNSGNKTCRNVMAYSSDFNIGLNIDDEDLGLFEHTTHSFITTSANKLYCYAVSSDISASTNEHYWIKGNYKIW